MLTNVLLRHVVKTALVLLLPAFAVAWLALGGHAAFGLLIGAAVSVGDALGLIYLVGRMLEPGQSGPKKGIFALILVLKLVIVGGILYAAVLKLGVSQIGLVFGIGIGLTATVVGANRGSTSREGQAAMARAEAEIAQEQGQEMGDNADESR